MSRAQLDLRYGICYSQSRYRYSPSALLHSQGLGNATRVEMAQSMIELLHPGAAASQFSGSIHLSISFVPVLDVSSNGKEGNAHTVHWIHHQATATGGRWTGFETVHAVFMEGVS